MDPNSISVIAESTDWGFVSTVVQIIAYLTTCIASLTTCLAMLLTAAVAIYGITAWRREFRGKRQIELAEEVLSLFYQAHDAIEAIRSPLGYSTEGSTRKRRDDETPKQTAAWDMAYVATERYERWREMFSKLQSLRYRFMVQIGKEEAEPFEEIRKVLNRIFGASRRLANLWIRRECAVREKQLEDLGKEIQRYEAIFWFGEEDDKIGERVEKAVSQMEDTCRNIIMRKSPHKSAKAMGKGNKENLK